MSVAKNTRNIKARRRLADLYVKGSELRFGPDGVRTGPFEEPPGDDEVALWIQPPSPLQREQSLREAQAVRARAVLAAKRDKDSEEHLTAQVFVADMSDEALIEYLITINEEDRQQEAMREVLKREEWEDFTQLQDSMRQWEEAGSPEDDPEWEPLLERDRVYGEQVRVRSQELRDAAREAMQLMPRAEIERRAIDRRIELVGSQEFIREYELQMVFYACRDWEDHHELFFETAREVAELPDMVQEELGQALTVFINEVRDAKNSPRAVDGSEQSAPPEEQETSEASTPEAVSA